MAFALDNNTDGFEVSDDFQLSTKIMVFGVGGGGGNAVANIAKSDLTDVDYVIANTDVRALIQKKNDKECSSRLDAIQLGRKTSRGEGAGNDPAKGKASAEETREEIAEKLDDVSMLFVTAGMGGGTGTGAAPVVASVAKEKDILTIGVVTKPFKYEGSSKMEQAMAGINEMKKYVDALIVIPNESLTKLKGTKLTLKNAFVEVDNVLRKAVLGIISLLQVDGYFNVDFADVKKVLKDSGMAHMAIGKGKGDNKLDDALNEVLHSPLLETSIEGARRGLVNVSVPETFSFDEFDNIMNEVTGRLNEHAEFKGGVVFDSELADDEISLIVVATDFADNDSGADNPADDAAAEADDPIPPVTVTSSPDGLSSNIGFGTDSNDMDALLKMFNHNKGF